MAHDLFSALDLSLCGDGVLVSIVVRENDEPTVKTALFPWITLIGGFVEDITVETEAGTALRMSFDQAEQEILSVIDGLRSAASEVDDIFEPLLEDGEFPDDPVQLEMEELLMDVKGRA